MPQLDDRVASRERNRRSHAGLEGAVRRPAHRSGGGRSEAPVHVVRVPGGFAFVENRAAERR